VWMLFLPRRWRIVCFFIVTPWQIGVILTANYTFLNYLVLALGVLLLDDRFVLDIVPERWASRLRRALGSRQSAGMVPPVGESVARRWELAKLTISSLLMVWVGYATTAQMIWMFTKVPLPTTPVSALEPFRIANRYGLFAVMTRGRFEIEFQGSNDGQTWIAYPFRYKPQALDRPPGIYAPYQPRFDWNLWFASLGSWRDYPFVPNTEVRLLENEKDVLALFAGNPFSQAPPHQIRAVLWQYWFTTMAEKRATGVWWRRELVGLYAPTLEWSAGGEIKVVEWPAVGARRQIE